MDRIDRIARCYREESDTSQCRAEADRSGLRHIGSGETRDVYRDPSTSTPERVYKFPHGRSMPYRSAKERNVWEGEIWGEAGPHIRKHLAPVLDVEEGGEWLEMPYATDTAEWEEGDRLYHKLAEQGLECPDAGGIGNIRELNGRPVVVDYAGCTWKR